MALDLESLVLPTKYKMAIFQFRLVAIIMGFLLKHDLLLRQVFNECVTNF